MSDSSSGWDWRRSGESTEADQPSEWAERAAAPPDAPGSTSAPHVPSDSGADATPAPPPFDGAQPPPTGSSDPGEVDLDLWREAREPSREHRRFRTRSRSGFSGRTILGVFGLLSLLVTIGIMGLLGARVLESLGGTDTASIPGSQGQGPADIAAADAATCAMDLRALTTAVNAHEAMTGAPPASQDELLATGVLAEPVSSYTFRVEGTDVLYEGQGVCAGS